jgi:putative ABC transport system substrate-binding protein
MLAKISKANRIGFVSVVGAPNAPGAHVEAFRQGLRDLGYAEGKYFMLELRYVEGRTDRVPSLVAELVQLKVDVLVLRSMPSIRAAMQATKTIPIVMSTIRTQSRLGLSIACRAPAEMSRGLRPLRES